MSFWEIYLIAGGILLAFMTIVWVASVVLKNASIVDVFWGVNFILAAWFYYWQSHNDDIRSVVVVALVTIWGLRLSIYILWRNWGEGEDFRYQKFRQDFGPERYWWISYFQVYVLQGVLAWLISAPLLAAMYYQATFGIFDYVAIALWSIGLFFETVGDWQLARFKANPDNKGKLLDKGVWRYTRHPNYFGDACVWWGYACFSIAVHCYYPVLSSLLMTFFLVKVSGVALLEKTLSKKKPGYEEYVRSTNAFIPWFPKKGK